MKTDKYLRKILCIHIIGGYPGYLNRPSYPYGGRKKPFYGSYGVSKPQHLRHDSLMQMIKPIIPHAITDPPPPPEDPNIKVVRGVLNTTHDFYQLLHDSAMIFPRC